MADNIKLAVTSGEALSIAAINAPNQVGHIDHINHIDHNHSIVELSGVPTVRRIKIRRDKGGTLHLELEE